MQRYSELIPLLKGQFGYKTFGKRGGRGSPSGPGAFMGLKLDNAAEISWLDTGAERGEGSWMKLGCLQEECKKEH